MRKSFYLYLLVLLVFNSIAFGHGYFFNFKLPISLWILVPLAIVFSVIPWLINEKIEFTKKKNLNVKNILKAVILSVASVIFMLVSLIASTFATMVVPGSREHNYVMYSICLPAMKKHYASRNPEEIPNLFDLHPKCEQNVWAGRDPLEGFE